MTIDLTINMILINVILFLFLKNKFKGLELLFRVCSGFRANKT